MSKCYLSEFFILLILPAFFFKKHVFFSKELVFVSIKTLFSLVCVFACQGEDGKKCKKLVQMTDNVGKIIELVNLVGEALPELVIRY